MAESLSSPWQGVDTGTGGGGTYPRNLWSEHRGACRLLGDKFRCLLRYWRNRLATGSGRLMAVNMSLPAFPILNPNCNLAFYSRLNSLRLRLVLRHGTIVILQILQDYNRQCDMGQGMRPSNGFLFGSLIRPSMPLPLSLSDYVTGNVWSGIQCPAVVECER